jgi:hypothetical protein
MNTLIELVDKAVDRYWDSEPHTALIQGIEALQSQLDDYTVLMTAKCDSLQAEVERLTVRYEDVVSEEHNTAQLRHLLWESFDEKQKCYFAVEQHQKAVANLIAERDTLRAELAAPAELQKDAERLDYMLTNWLYSLANIAGIPYGNYTPNEDTKAKLLVHIDALLKQQEISIGSAHQNNSIPP